MDEGTDERLIHRTRQIELGKATLGYKLSRKKPPSVKLNCSKRTWAGIVRAWRRELHTYDPSTTYEWYCAYKSYPKETLQLAWDITTAPEGVASFPPNDIAETARRIHGL